MSGSRLFRAVQLLAAVVVPAGTFAAVRDNALQHPILTLVLLCAWELVVTFSGLAIKVYRKLEEVWVDQAADAVDGMAQRALSRYGRHYRKYISRIHHDVDVRGLSTWGMYALAMEHVFVDLSVVPRPVDAVPAGPVDEAPSSDGPVRRTVWDLLAHHPKEPLAVIGPPGSGKTTLLKHLALVMSGQQRRWKVARRWRRKIPILLSLRDHAQQIGDDPGITVAALVRSRLGAWAAHEPKRWFERQLDRSRCVVMLDGLDEVGRQADREKVVEWAERQIRDYPGNHFILTSRPLGYKAYPLNYANVVQVCQFSDDQIETFIRAWYRTIEIRDAGRDDIGVQLRADGGAEDLLGRLYAKPALLSMAVNPLLLTMIALVHKYRSALPRSRAELYKEICEVFVGKRQAAKKLTSELSLEQKLVVLRSLALEMMRRRVREIDTAEARTIVRKPLQKTSYSGDPDAFLTEVEQSSGLLLERESGRLAFAHLTFQEYLAASFINEQGRVRLIQENLLDPWWRETILLWSSAADATPVIARVLDADPPTVEGLLFAADCAEEAREVAPPVRSRLNEALSLRARESDPAQRRLLAEVLLARKARNGIVLPGGDLLCIDPVTAAEYDLFLRELDDPASVHGISAQACRPTAAGDGPVRGLTTEAAQQFVAWSRGLGLDVRLPIAEELTAATARSLVRPPLVEFWTSEQLLPTRIGSLPTPDFDALLRTQLVLDYEMVAAALGAAAESVGVKHGRWWAVHARPDPLDALPEELVEVLRWRAENVPRRTIHHYVALLKALQGPVDGMRVRLERRWGEPATAHTVAPLPDESTLVGGFRQAYWRMVWWGRQVAGELGDYPVQLLVSLLRQWQVDGRIPRADGLVLVCRNPRRDLAVPRQKAPASAKARASRS